MRLFEVLEVSKPKFFDSSTISFPGAPAGLRIPTHAAADARCRRAHFKFNY